MARPPTGPPPVLQSAVAVRPDRERADLRTYASIATAFEREDRRADLRAMFGGSDELVERFLAVALNAIATNSDLLINADPVTIIQAVKDSATMGLEPTGLLGEGAIIRYGKVARFMPMYRGYLKRIYNSGKVSTVKANVVYINDKFDYSWDSDGPHYTHSPVIPSDATGLDPDGESQRGDFRGAYCAINYVNGARDFDFMPAVEINAIRDRYSQSSKGSPWDTAWGEMAKKTVIRRLAKTQVQLAVALNPLMVADAIVDEGRNEAEKSTRLDVSRARSAVLAAVAGHRGPQEAIAAPEPVVAATNDPDAPVPVDEEAEDAVEVEVADPDEPPPFPLS